VCHSEPIRSRARAQRGNESSSEAGSNARPARSTANVNATSIVAPPKGTTAMHSSHWNTSHSPRSGSTTVPDLNSSRPHLGQGNRPLVTMKALSVRQPWAWAIIHGGKRFENRTWRTDHRGPLLIHAARARVDLDAGRRLVPGLPAEDELDFGALVGLVQLVDVLPARECPRADPFVEGPLCWVLEDPRPLVPVPYRGRLQLFDVPAGLVRLKS
jgi:hypothetical protein